MATIKARLVEIKRKPKHAQKRLVKNLIKFNEAVGGKLRWRAITLEVRGPKGKYLGGLVGGTFWNCLSVDALWLDASARRKGLGSELLQRAEAIAKERGCSQAGTSTLDFQALGFYKKHGYKVCGIMRDVPTGHRSYWLSKRLPKKRA